MSSTYQTFQCLLYSGQRVGVLVHMFKWWKLMLNHRPPSFFLTNTTALNHALWLGQDSTRLQHLSRDGFGPPLPKAEGICLNCLLKGGVIHYLYHMLCGVSTAQLCGVQWKHIMVSMAKSQQAPSASSRVQDSNPLKSSSSNSFPCHCLTVNFGAQGSWGSFPHSCNWASTGDLRQLGCCNCPDHWGFLQEGLWVSHTVPYHHNCLLTALPQLCVHIWYGEALQQGAGLQSVRAWAMTLIHPPV